VALLVLGAALIVYYAFVHVHIIQKEDQVFYTTWFYEWFLIPVLLSFAFAAPLHRSLGSCGVTSRYHGYNANTTHPTSPTIPFLDKSGDNTEDKIQEELQQRTSSCCCSREERLKLLQDDPGTQRLVMAVLICYLVYVLGDAAFFIPISPRHTHVTTYVVYLLAVLTNMGFIYQGFLLTILAMRAFIVRLHALENEINHVLQQETIFAAMNQEHQSPASTTRRLSSPVLVVKHRRPEVPVLRWTHTYQELRHDMLNLSHHFGFRMVVGVVMFVVEVTNIILSCWEAIGSHLTKLQTVLLILTYAANAAILIMVVFQTAYTATLSMEQIGPAVAILSLRRASHSADQAAELNVLAQTFMQAPIRLRAGNFHVNADYANALTAWFFGLFLAIFGMKLPSM
jgi:hypothetical protein